MICFDTNLWVRYVTNDQPIQAKRVVELLGAGEEVFVPKTVVLELEWVLRAVYGVPRASIERAILHILGLAQVYPEQPEQLAAALEHYRLGLDFADALHQASAPNSRFYSFDAKLVAKGRPLGLDLESAQG